ncbi:MAG: hypothetical protein HYV03_01450 [Deltaproteobacteria bacterium]|nr:hypothetical protein [Deltaproteobacteria bacterium]
MKFSISIPAGMGQEIRHLATESQRPVSWWVRRAWELARTQLLRGDTVEKRRRSAIRKFRRLSGCLRPYVARGTTSVDLAHTAFQRKR